MVPTLILSNTLLGLHMMLVITAFTPSRLLTQPPKKGHVNSCLEDPVLCRETCLPFNENYRGWHVSSVKDLPWNVFGAGLVTSKAALAGDMVLTLVLSNTLILLDTNVDYT